jgi:NOL1/NOP2/fmu family ribosome biogenesis protein
MFRKDPRAVEEWTPELVKLCASRQKRILADAWPSLRKGGLLIYSTCTFEEEENDCNLEWAASELGGSIVPPADAPEGVRLTRSGYMLVPGEVPGEGQWAGALFKESEGGDLRGAISDLRPLRQGVKKGIQKGKDFVPDAEYALSLDFCRDDYPMVELDLQTALKFLHRDSFAIKDAPLGYLAVCYQGHPLGFVKNLGNRCNNLLPAARRIRMDV